MSNPISGFGAFQQLDPVAAAAPTQQAKQIAKTQAVAPQDTVKISQDARVASQAQQQQVSGDKNDDGDSK
jgi:hypothetical protein